MSTPLELRTMAAVLRQGAPLDRLSQLLLAVTVALAAWYAAGGALLALAWCGVAVLAGLLQRYWAARVSLDVALLEAVLAEPDLPRAGADLDAVLQRLGLRRTPPPPRDWLARWQGMRGLLRRQVLCFAVQVLAVLLALCTVPAGREAMTRRPTSLLPAAVAADHAVRWQCRQADGCGVRGVALPALVRRAARPARGSPAPAAQRRGAAPAFGIPMRAIVRELEWT